MNLKKAKPYILSIAIALAVGGLSAFLTRNSMDIYSELITPPLAPPAIVFPIVWTLLYVLMGVSAARIGTNATAPREQIEKALLVYAFSLFVNFTWSLIFFNLRDILFAFAWLLILWILVLVTILDYYKINRAAAYLQIPYLLWCTFALYLNLGIYLLNR